jgi:hypothetical protein
MKKISKVKFMDNGCIRFSINSVKFEDEVDCHLLVSEMCERLTKKFKRIIKPEELSIHQYCVNNGEFEDWCGWYNCLAYIFETILAIEYDPICGIVYIET